MSRQGRISSIYSDHLGTTFGVWYLLIINASLSVADTGDKLSVVQNERLLHVFYRNSNALVNNVTYTTGKHTFKNFTVDAFECINASVGNYFD